MKRKISNFFENSSQSFGKTALCGVVGSERKIRGFGNLPNKQNRPLSTDRKRTILRKGHPLPMLAIQFSLRQTAKGRERNGKETRYGKQRIYSRKGQSVMGGRFFMRPGSASHCGTQLSCRLQKKYSEGMNQTGLPGI